MRLPSVTNSESGLFMDGQRLGDRLLASGEYVPDGDNALVLYSPETGAEDELTVQDLARMDASSLVRRLVSRGFVLDLGKALLIAGLLWSLYGGRVALGPQGYQTPDQFWQDRLQEQRAFLAAMPAPHADAGRCASW